MKKLTMIVIAMPQDSIICPQMPSNDIHIDKKTGARTNKSY